ncbi:NAD(P)-dependent oxidoreductase, partial [bacterium]|nr:NAD(P)-dependent oxidoreductase [bacterium]
MRIGFVGLGIMGKSMALNLVKAGFEVTVWNRTPDKKVSLVEAGAHAADTLTALGNEQEVVITIVNDTPDAEEVLFGDTGLINGLSPGAVVVDMSTISPEATQDFAARLEAAGCEMLDAPVSGG